eukprot:13519380-Alexandrium_andersonii.AAC.1
MLPPSPRARLRSQLTQRALRLGICENETPYFRSERWRRRAKRWANVGPRWVPQPPTGGPGGPLFEFR